jgi:hypothetical protein
MKEKKLLVNILLKISHQIVKIVEQMIHYWLIKMFSLAVDKEKNRKEREKITS